MRLRSVCLSVFLVLMSVADLRADERAALTLVSTELLSGLLATTEEGVEGVYPDFFKAAALQADVDINYRIVPWSRAVLETEKSRNYLLFPLTRTVQREQRFTWLAKLWEVPICFISVTHPIDSFAEAKQLEGIMVWRGSSHQQKLLDLGFENLATFDDPRLVEKVLAKRTHAAWYSPCNEGRNLCETLGLQDEVFIGKPVDSESIWLAAGKNYVSTPERARFIEAVATSAEKGALRHLASEQD